MRFIAANLKNIVLILVIWFTPYYLSWMSASAFAHALDTSFYLMLIAQITVFLFLAAFWTVYLGPRVILWIGLKWVKSKFTESVKSFTNKSID